MNIPSAKYLKNKARNRLEAGKNPQEVILWYSGISAGAALITTAVQYLLNNRIAQTGGLQNIGIRSILTTAGNVLPILQAVLMLCLDLGYLAAMLRISRRQFASAKTLKAGAERFWPLLCSWLLRGAIYLGVMLGASLVATRIFLLTPFSKAFTEIMGSLVSSGLITTEAIQELLIENELVADQVFATLTPMLIIYAVLAIPASIYVSYLFRLVDYLIIDHPGVGASYALRQSRILMRGNKLRLLKVDLSFWWYYLVRMGVSMLLYADLILALFGITLPFSAEVIFFGTVILSLGAEFAANYFLRNRVEITYALAYTSLVPKEETGGAVLGNIFTM